MSVQAEDLYLKGVMAYNVQDYKAASAYWEQTLAKDSEHAKAKQGLERIQQLTAAKPKRSSKDVFQDIKKLYSEKKFAEALRLTELLLKKHPENSDLQNLREKLEARVKPSGKPVVSDTKRSTMVIAAAAELSVGDSPEQRSVQVERLIQDGVSLYEIQDYQQAIAVWQKALALDPGNRIARDYVQNVSALLASESQEDDATPDPLEEAATVVAAKPSREKMLEIYNQAMGHFKARRYQEALELWNQILTFFPSHAETLQCIEKTRAIMAKDQAYQDQLDQVHSAIAANQLAEAESLLTRLSIEAPHLALDDARAALERARASSSQRIETIQSLAAEMPVAKPSAARPGPAADDNRDHHSATDEEITSFFEPTQKAQAGPRKVVAAAPIKKKKQAQVNVFLWIGVVVGIGLLGAGGYFGWDYYKKQLTIKTTEPLFVADVEWGSEERIAEDFLNFGNDFEDDGDFLLALFAYQRTESIAAKRCDSLRAQEGEHSPEWERELSVLTERLGKAKARLREVQRKIRGGQVDSSALDLARTAFRREEFEDAVERLGAVLMSDPTNERARDLLGQAHERLGFKKMAAGDVSGASNHFKCAAVLETSFDMPRRHMEVIQRFFAGDIRKEDKDQWFFFFN